MDRLNHVNIKHEGEEDLKEDSKPNNQGSTSPIQRCTKVKKEEEDGECKVEWDGDECDCLECRVEREIKIELPGPSNANKDPSLQCKRVKKEEQDDYDEWDEDCDCGQCRRMREKAIRLGKSNATENQRLNEGDGEDDGEETEVEECDNGNDGDLVENDGDLKVADEDSEGGNELDKCETENNQEGSESQMSDADDETEIDDEEYEMDVDSEKSSDDETEVDEDFEQDDQSTQIHPNRHSKKKSIKCTWKGCSKTFAKPYKLRYHLNFHKKEKSFKCPWEGCNVACYRPDSIAAHYKLKHLREFSHVCEHCGKGFNGQVVFNRHLRVHTGERPFKCSWTGCDKKHLLKNQLCANTI